MPLGLFEGFGIELEYMIVDQESLKVRPIADQLLNVLGRAAGAREVELGPVAWSNELVNHVIELKSNGPARDLARLHQDFVSSIAQVNQILAEQFSACLLPSAMHPFFEPDLETVLWQEEDASIYSAYHRIFDCKGHGWSNLQSIHINLPFKNDHEFKKLHAAIRLLLPLLPPLAASSPIVWGEVQTVDDSRLRFYLQNQKRIPEIIGEVIPEAVFSREEYEKKILKPMYQAISPLDQEGLLQHEWLNSRAAIAKFDKSCIEIRVLDIGEAPSSDFAIIYAAIAFLTRLVEDFPNTGDRQQGMLAKDLKEIFLKGLEQGLSYLITDLSYLEALGFREQLTIAQIWQEILKDSSSSSRIPAPYAKTLAFILEKGNLATRIRGQWVAGGSLNDKKSIYHELSRCLKEDRVYAPQS